MPKNITVTAEDTSVKDQTDEKTTIERRMQIHHKRVKKKRRVNQL